MSVIATLQAEARRAKRILFALCLLLPATAHSQQVPWVRNDGAQSVLVGKNLNPSSGATDQYGHPYSSVPSPTGGWTKTAYYAQTTTVRTLKATGGTLGGYYIFNPNGSAACVQFFDVATATAVTLGTTVPDVSFCVPAGGAANIEFGMGINFANGVKLAITTTTTGSTAPGVGADVNIFYK